MAAAINDSLDALEFSVERLTNVASTIEATHFDDSAHPTEWSIADVFSHIGSGAVIFTRRLEDAVSDREVDPDFNQSVWDEWNAKSPADQVADGLGADGAMLAYMRALDDASRGHVQIHMGPLALNFEAIVSMRLNEHSMHTWDIEVAVNPAATVPAEIAGLVVDNLQIVTQFSAKPSGEPRTVKVSTHDPERHFAIEIGPDSLELVPVASMTTADLELPAEAFARLVYGRLDPSHTPSGVEGPIIESLRRMFPGI